MSSIRRWTAILVAAGVLVAGTAMAAGASASGVTTKPVVRGGFGDANDASRGLDRRRGPFYGLRVNAMDVAADAMNLAWFEYECDGLTADEGRRKYQLVRTAYLGKVTPDADCDEILGVLIPPGATVEYQARAVTTRWIRDVGPNGKTPVGGFVGEMGVAVVRTDGSDRAPVPLLSLRLIGTSGLRPGRAPEADPTAARGDRCSAPLHDEGFYQGGFDRRGLVTLFGKTRENAENIKVFRRLADARVIGTFEGKLELAPTADARPYRFGVISSAAWWFDGLVGWKKKQ